MSVPAGVWIPAGTVEPPRWTPLLVAVADGVVPRVFVEWDGVRWLYYNRDMPFLSTISYWMTLPPYPSPEPPKQEEQIKCPYCSGRFFITYLR